MCLIIILMQAVILSCHLTLVDKFYVSFWIIGCEICKTRNLICISRECTVNIITQI